MQRLFLPRARGAMDYDKQILSISRARGTVIMIAEAVPIACAGDCDYNRRGCSWRVRGGYDYDRRGCSAYVGAMIMIAEAVPRSRGLCF